MASSTWRWVLLALVASLLISNLMVPCVRASEEEEDEAEPAGGAGGYEAGEGEGTEVVSSGEDVEEAEEEVALVPASGVTTELIFPAFVGKLPLLRAGQQAQILLGISNNGPPLVLSGLLARLYVQYDSRIVAQNFTGEFPSNLTLANATVSEGAQTSFTFHFTPYKLLQPMPFGLAATLYYTVDGAPHASVLFNSTVEIIEPAGVVSGETVFLVLLGVGVLALVAMWGSQQLESLSKRAKRSKRVETGTSEAADSANEWLQGTFFTSTSKASKAGAVKPKSKKK